MKFTYLIRGTDGEGEAWSSQGTVEAMNIDAALGAAREETFRGLMRDENRIGCGGPYRVVQINVEAMT